MRHDHILQMIGRGEKNTKVDTPGFREVSIPIIIFSKLMCVTDSFTLKFSNPTADLLT